MWSAAIIARRRARLGEELEADFQEHGAAALDEMPVKDPTAYVRVIASILPKEVKLTTAQELTDGQLDEGIKALQEALAREAGADQWS